MATKYAPGDKVCFLPTEDQRLFLLPNKDYQQEGKPWYSSKKPAGKNTIASYIKNISRKLNLSKNYSNHTVGRTSVVSCLSNAGFAPHQISNLTRHKNLQSLESYRDNQLAQSDVMDIHETLLNTLDENSTPTTSKQNQDEIAEKADQPVIFNLSDYASTSTTTPMSFLSNAIIHGNVVFNIKQ